MHCKIIFNLIIYFINEFYIFIDDIITIYITYAVKMKYEIKYKIRLVFNIIFDSRKIKGKRIDRERSLLLILGSWNCIIGRDILLSISPLLFPIIRLELMTARMLYVIVHKISNQNLFGRESCTSWLGRMHLIGFTE